MSIIEVILLGVGLSMDAAAVSMTNGLNEPKMKLQKVLLIGLFYGVFQAIMPLIGYFAGSAFTSFISKFTPWLALILLSIIGGKMLADGFKKNTEDSETKNLKIGELTVQAISTSIDALAVGLIFINYEAKIVLIDVAIIGLTTFILSIIAIYFGKKFGQLLENKAKIIGGLILIGIGLKIFIEYLLTL